MATAITSGSLTGTTTLLTGRAFLNSVHLFGDGTNAATVTIYDNTAGSGTIIAKLVLPAATATALYEDFVPNKPIRGDTGLTVVVSGTGASAIVSFGAGS